MLGPWSLTRHTPPRAHPKTPRGERDTNPEAATPPAAFRERPPTYGAAPRGVLWNVKESKTSLSHKHEPARGLFRGLREKDREALPRRPHFDPLGFSAQWFPLGLEATVSPAGGDLGLAARRGQGRRPHPGRLPATPGNHLLRLMTSNSFSADFNWENFHNFIKPGTFKFLGPARRAFYKTLSARWVFNSLKSDAFLEGWKLERSLWVQADSGARRARNTLNGSGVATEREPVRGDRCLPYANTKTDG